MKNADKLPAVIGFGNALVDVIHSLENDDILAKLGLPRGSMTLVDDELSAKIYGSAENVRRQTTTGGSAANTIHSLASLGAPCGYLGKIGTDELGKIFREEFEQKQVKTHLLLSQKPTGRVMALVSPDSERTMATYLGAAADMKPEELTPAIFSGYSILYIEGYLVQDHRLIETAIDLARSNGLKVAVDLSSYNIVEENLEFLKYLVSQKINMVFANEEEALAFTGKKPGEALKEIASMCELAVVKIGREGSLVKRGDEKIKIDAIPATAVDTTGAGDNYAAGFLYGLVNNFSLEKCGRIGSLLSGKVVEVMGAKIPREIWPEILKSVDEMN